MQDSAWSAIISPYPDAQILIVTSDELKKNAAASEFGGYGAVQRVAIIKAKNDVQVSYTNPVYMANAYRMKGDLSGTATALAGALGKVEEFGAKGLTAAKFATPKHIVQKVIEATRNPRNHRYSASRGITKLRMAICDWYRRRYDVKLDPESEAIVTMGAKEGLAHLALAVIGPGDVVFAPSPTCPIHPYSVIIAGGDLRSIPMSCDRDFLEDLTTAAKLTWPKPKMLILSYPHNPTTQVVDIPFFEKIVAFAKKHQIFVVHDFAYANLCFDGYEAPSFLQVKGAKEL